MPDVRAALRQRLVGRAYLPVMQGEVCLAHGRWMADAGAGYEWGTNVTRKTQH